MTLNDLNITSDWTLFLDRDGVINKKLDNDYVKHWTEFEFIEGVTDAIKYLSTCFSKIVVVTNQQGIGKGLYRVEDLELIHGNMLYEIAFYGGKIDKVYFSPYLQAANHPTRKPGIGMALQAKTDFPDINFSKSIIVNKGLKNEGVDVVLDRLKKKGTKPGFVLGISIARTNLPESASVPNGIADYVESFKKVVESGLGDYYTINISCPNTCGGEPFTTADLLSKLFIELDKIARSKPLYVKMPINVLDNVFVQLLGVLDHHNVQGVIVGNLNKDYSTLDKRDPVPSEYRGGLSGRPCFSRSNELIALTKKEYQNRFTIIGCGGVFSYEDAKVKFDLGADLIHMITGMIYEGPGLIQKICRGLSKK